MSVSAAFTAWNLRRNCQLLNIKQHRDHVTKLPYTCRINMSGFSVTLHDETLIVYQSATIRDISFQQIGTFGWISVLLNKFILHNQNKTRT